MTDTTATEAPTTSTNSTPTPTSTPPAHRPGLVALLRLAAAALEAGRPAPPAS